MTADDFALPEPATSPTDQRNSSSAGSPR